MKNWKKPEIYQLGIENTEADTFNSGEHDGVWVDVNYKGKVYPVELHS